MHGQIQKSRERPRELRRRVMLRARLRARTGWSDACILNVSSRGLMINASKPVTGDTVELWHGDQLIVGTVMWRKGTRAGVQTDDQIPVNNILALSKSPSLQLTASTWPEVERRKTPRSHDDSRLRGRSIEYLGILIVGICLAAGVAGFVEEAFARPLQLVRSTLGS